MRRCGQCSERMVRCHGWQPSVTTSFSLFPFAMQTATNSGFSFSPLWQQLMKAPLSPGFQVFLWRPSGFSLEAFRGFFGGHQGLLWRPSGDSLEAFRGFFGGHQGLLLGLSGNSLEAFLDFFEGLKGLNWRPSGTSLEAHF